MSENRVALIEKVFSKLDRDGTGVVTMKDLDGIYNYLDHPQYISGEKTKHQIFKDFLNTFERSGVVDGKVKNFGYFETENRISQRETAKICVEWTKRPKILIF